MWGLVLGGCVIAGCGRFHFDPVETSTGDAAIIDSDGTSSEDGSIDGPSSVTYTASIAECLDPGDPDPAFCRANNGATELPVDLDDDNLGVPFYSYVRFDFDQAIAGREVMAVRLSLVVTDGSQSHGPNAGEIWRVATFTAAELNTQTPAQLGGAAIAGDQGPVVQLEEVTWSLPTAIIDNNFLCLGIVPVSGNSVNYWNLMGPNPPRIRIDLR
jgi:hypothetical protein